MLSEIQQLKEIAERCRDGGSIDPRLAQWLGSCLEDYLARRACRLEEAFGIRAGRGGLPWRVEQAIRSRDAALRALAAKLGPFPSVTTKARHIALLSQRYAVSAWRFDRLRSTMPDAYPGTEKEHLWVAFRSGARMPIGERQLRHIVQD